MLRSIHPLFRFLITAGLLYLAWFLIYDLVIQPDGRIDRVIASNMVYLSDLALSWLGYTVNSENRMIVLEGTAGLWVGNACNGLPLFALFSGFILAFPGPVLKKLYFIPIGILSIHLLNTLRVIGLSLTQNYTAQLLDFNHTYTFTIIIYGFIFLLWMIWVNKLKKPQGADEEGSDLLLT